jgi:hypothetical protein
MGISESQMETKLQPFFKTVSEAHFELLKARVAERDAHDRLDSLLTQPIVREELELAHARAKRASADLERAQIRLMNAQTAMAFAFEARGEEEVAS